MWFALVLACTTTTPEPPPRLGDGRVDPGEVCDPGMGTSETCPDGWHVCRICGPDGTWTLAGQAVPSFLNDPPAQGRVDLVLDPEPRQRGIWAFERDDRGRIEAQWTGHGEGGADRIVRAEWDEHGLPVRQWPDPELDALLETWTVDQADGTKATMRGQRGVWWVAPESLRFEHQVDGKGRPVKTVRHRTDATGQERVSSTRWRYDERGRTVLVEQDPDHDGIVDVTQHWRWDDEARTVRIERRRSDGSPDGADEVRRFDVQGRIVEVALVLNVSPRPWRGTSFAPDGRILETWENPSLDGRRVVSVHTWEDGGRVRRITTERDGVRAWSRTTFRDDGLPERRSIDTDGDGKADEETLWSYDEQDIARWLTEAPIPQRRIIGIPPR